MTTKQYRKVRARFHELVLAEAMGTASEGDICKLKRYQALLRYRPSPLERMRCSRFEYQGQLMIKFARAVYDHQKPPPQRVMDLLNSRFWELV